MEPVKKITGLAKLVAAAVTVQAALGGGLIWYGISMSSIFVTGIGAVLVVAAALEMLRLMIKASKYG